MARSSKTSPLRLKWPKTLKWRIVTTKTRNKEKRMAKKFGTLSVFWDREVDYSKIYR